MGEPGFLSAAVEIPALKKLTPSTANPGGDSVRCVRQASEALESDFN